MTENSVNNTNPVQQQYANNTTPNIPPEYTPLSPWAYIGYSLLFSIPVIGFIMVLVYAFDSTSNINRRNFAKSNLYMLLISAVISILIILFVIVLVAIGVASFDYAASSVSSL